MTEKDSNILTTLENDQHQSIQNFMIVWLDSNTNEKDNLINQLRCSVSDLVLTYNEPDSCVDFLTNVHDQNVFLIVSITFAKIVLPLIHNIPQLHSIYIFINNKSMHNEWFKGWRKVREISDDILLIIPQLQRTIRLYEESIIPINIISDISSVKSNEIEPSFMYTQLLKEIFVEMKYDEIAKQVFVDFLCILYANDKVQLNSIDLFKRTYEEHSAIWWYTKETFIFEILNRALRTQDINVLVKMGFFVQDLHKQIVQLHSETHHKTKLTVYRGQGMLNIDFEKLKKNKGGLLSFNSFLSTSMDESVSKAFEVSGDANLTGILFEIEIDPMISSVPFASLENISYYPQEEEILFSMHTIFKIGDMNEIGDRFWKIQLTLTNDNDEQLKCLTEYIRKEIGGRSQYHRLGWLMIKLNELDKAEEIYKKLLETTPNDHLEERANLYNNLGLIYDNKGNQSNKMEALNLYEKAIEIYQKNISSCLPALSATYSNIALVHKTMGNYDIALFYYKVACKIEETNPLSNETDVAAIENSIAAVYRSMGDFSSALTHFQIALKIRKEILPLNHPSLGISFNNIGVTYHSKGEYANALENYELALQIYRKSLPPVHPRPGETCNNKGLVYDSMGDYSNAILYYRKAIEIQRRSLPLKHPDLATTYKNIACTYTGRGNYTIALDYLKLALNIQKTVLPSIHADLASTYNNMGIVYDLVGNYQSALEYYQKTLDIQQKALSSMHPDLAMTYKNIGDIHCSMKDYSIALWYHEKALEIEKDSLAPAHPRLATTYNNIGVVYKHMGDFATAMSNFLQTLKIQQQCLSPTHPELALTYNNIGSIYNSQGNYSSALSYYDKVLEIQQKVLPSNHFHLALTHINIGVAHYRMKNYSTALLHFQKGLEIQQEVFSPTHSILADTYDQIAMVYYSIENYLSALSHFQTAISIRQKSAQSIQPELVMSYYNIAKTFERLDRYQEAIEYAQQAVHMARLAFGEDHSEVKENQEYLDKLRQKL